VGEPGLGELTERGRWTIETGGCGLVRGCELALGPVDHGRHLAASLERRQGAGRRSPVAWTPATVAVALDPGLGPEPPAHPRAVGAAPLHDPHQRAALALLD